MRGRRGGPLAVASIGAALVLAACGGGVKRTAAVSPVFRDVFASPASPAPSPAPVEPPSPLSGLPAAGGAPVFAVKIDNTAPSHPQVGLNSADEVYVEEVEGGLTRLLAVFSSRLPATVGPVRSVRTDNLDLLRQFGGPVAFAFSGGQPAVLSVVRNSGVADLSFDAAPADYWREPGRPAPYNLFTDPTRLLAGRSGLAPAKPMGFVFDELKAPTAGPGASVSVTYPSAGFLFTYRPATHDYTITQDGALVKGTDGAPEVAANVVVQRIQQAATAYQDVRGSYTPANLTVGGGPATVLRDGHAIDSTWSRASPDAGTRLLTRRTGVDVSLRPGTTWVLLLPAGGAMALT